MTRPTKAEFAIVLERILGKRIPGRPDQDPNVASTIQNFAIGSKREDSFGRAFRYGQVGNGAYGQTGAATMVRPLWGAYSAIVAAVIEASVAALNAVLGTKVVSYTAIAAFPANHFQGGFLEYVHGGITYVCRISGHLASAAPAAVVQINLEDPLPTAITAGDVVNLHRSPFADVRSASQEAIEGVNMPNFTYRSVVGVPLVAGLAGQFMWFQVKGPCFGIPAGGNEGMLGYDREVSFDDDGSLQLSQLDYNVPNCRQHAGYILPVTQSALALPAVPAACTGCIYYMLDLSD